MHADRVSPSGGAVNLGREVLTIRSCCCFAKCTCVHTWYKQWNGGMLYHGRALFLNYYSYIDGYRYIYACIQAWILYVQHDKATARVVYYSSPLPLVLEQMAQLLPIQCSTRAERPRSEGEETPSPARHWLAFSACAPVTPFLSWHVLLVQLLGDSSNTTFDMNVRDYKFIYLKRQAPRQG